MPELPPSPGGATPPGSSSAEDALPSAKRAPPPIIPNIEFKGVVYSQGGSDTQPSGYVIASSPDTGAELWRVKVYEIVYDETLERDVQEVYFASMKLDAETGRLLIEDEIGRRFEVVLDIKLARPID